MIFKLACGDVMPGCTARFESRDHDTLMGEVVSHAASAHGMTDLSDDVLAAIQSKVAVAA